MSTVLSYSYAPAGCPPVTVSKAINTGTIGANVFASRNLGWLKEDFSLWPTPVVAGATYSWKVWYGFSSSNLNYYTETAPYITTPKMWHFGILPYYLKWELTISTSCGSKTLTGTKNNMSYMAPLIAKPETFMETDSSTYYFETRFTEADSAEYEKTVRNMIAHKFVEDPEDMTAINEMIGKVRMEALEPYLFFEDQEITDPGIISSSLSKSDDCLNISKAFPNPATQNIRIGLSDKFDKNKQIKYKIYNTLGQLTHTGSVKSDIDIRSLATGNYVLEINQNRQTERLKFVKE
ncbi:hypothetical protein DBR32_15175 [Taibaiella sp. KBW10]|uniref:T9SS type A sorting domain-containing protein n=1 Tax=Taibaiella sp. KBW10 TaxID=2153357 RepID=UPI000F5B2818|nr:T9SS type A sorting domain-containing protein [Taibaiella sp. KBW10]RQO29915.1 hypothetical protein DBR32_15175 [Taibaiella sp. KBW10]